MAKPVARKASAAASEATSTTTTSTSKQAAAATPPPKPSLPIAHLLSRTPLQLAAIYFTTLQAARMADDSNLDSDSNGTPISLTDPAAILSTFISKPIPTLLVLVSGVAFIQLWFGQWARSHRNAFLESGKKTKTAASAEVPKPKKGFTGALKDMANSAMAGKAPAAPKKGPSVQKVLESIDFMGPAALVIAASTVAFHIAAVLLGAPLTNKPFETLLLSALVALLSIGPIAIVVPHTDKYTWLRLFSSVSPANDLELALLAPALGAIAGCWLGALPIPLDWERPWQAWPTTCVVGTLLGHSVGSLVALGVCAYHAASEEAKKDKTA